MKKTAAALFVVFVFLMACAPTDEFVPGFSLPSTTLVLTVAYLEGDATLIREGAESPCAVDAVLSMNDAVRTGADGFCELTLESADTPLSTIRLGASTTLSVKTLFETAAAGRVVDLGMELGTILCRVRPLTAVDLFTVSTSYGVFGVRGTEFSVTATEASATVTVTQGSVAVLPPQLEPARLAAGFGSTDAGWTETVDAILSGAAAVEAGQELTVDAATMEQASEETTALMRVAGDLARERTVDPEEVRSRVESFVNRLRSVVPAARERSGETNSPVEEMGRRGTEIIPLGMEMVGLDAGMFLMGSAESVEGAPANETQHQVRISRAFSIGRFEVTYEEAVRVFNWGLVMGGIVYNRDDHTLRIGDTIILQDDAFRCMLYNQDGQMRIEEGYDRHPLGSVTWYGAVVFCNLLSEMEGYTPVYETTYWTRNLTANGYRLPTEAEWEYACRAGTATTYYWGDSAADIGRYANFADTNFPIGGGGLTMEDDGYAWTAPVGSYPANPWGLSDMSGNIMEWCYDAYGDYPPNEQTDPTGPAITEGMMPIARGGSFAKDPDALRSAWRWGYRPPDHLNGEFGFRVVRQ